MSVRFVVTELVVADMEAALAFYRRLGLDVAADADDQPHVDVDVGGGQRIAFDTHETIRSFTPDWEPPESAHHRIALAFECSSPDEVDRTHDDLVAAGHSSHLAPWDAFWGQRYAAVLDPDGNVVDLFAALPSA